MQYLREMGAFRIGNSLAGQERRCAGDHVHRTPQVMRGLTPYFRSLPLELLEFLERTLQIAHPAGRLGLLQARVARSALAHPFRAQLHQRCPRSRHGGLVKFLMFARKALELCEHTKMQVPPLSHGLALVVPLLPAVQAVLCSVFPLLLACLALFA